VLCPDQEEHYDARDMRRLAMTKRFVVVFLAAASVGMLVLAPAPAAAQASAPAERAKWIRDFSGVWASQLGRGGVLPGEEVSLTKFGAEQYNKIDEADSPAYRCEPHGPTRMLQSAEDIMIFQQDSMLGIISEHINDGYRIIYMNGKHPESMAYPEWNGHSVGHWEGDILVVDTIGVREDSWLNSAGLQHSDQMHMVERFQKTSPDTFTVKVTIEDPVYFTKPFTYGLAQLRDVNGFISERCSDTPLDEKYTLTHGKAGPTENPPPTFPPGVARTYIGANEAARGRGGRGGDGGAAPMVKKTKFEEDIIKTSGGDLKITSIAGYSVMFTYQGKVIDVDPVGRAADYSLLPKADVILVTHAGPAHDDPETVRLLSKDKTALEVCPLCSLDLPTGTIMINDESKTVAGLKIEAVPAYEVKGKFGVFRPTKGASNGYVITFGDKRVYVGGETENVPEMKALKQIDAAFLPVIRTMPPAMFADAVKAMQPKIVFPYAYGSNDPKELTALLKDNQGIDVRVRDLR
jgi:L-ascorbate metabolism protein UlaG (beta-lactamase superfamily)